MNDCVQGGIADTLTVCDAAATKWSQVVSKGKNGFTRQSVSAISYPLPLPNKPRPEATLNGFEDKRMGSSNTYDKCKRKAEGCCIENMMLRHVRNG